MGLNGYIPDMESSRVPRSVFGASLASPVLAPPSRSSERLVQWVESDPDGFHDLRNQQNTVNGTCREADGPQHETGNYETRAGYESLLSLALVLKNLPSFDDLFAALPNKLLTIVDFDFIGITVFDEQSQSVNWHFSDLEGWVRSNIIAEKNGDTIAEWIYQHQEPLILPIPAHQLEWQEEIENLAGAGLRSICALPLTFLHKRLGSMHIGSKREAAYPKSEVRFLSSIADLVASAIDNTSNFEALCRAKEELRGERERLSLLLELSNRLISGHERKELLKGVCASVRRMTNCDAVAVHLPNHATNKLQLVAMDSPGKSEAMDEDSLGALEGKQALTQPVMQANRRDKASRRVSRGLATKSRRPRAQSRTPPSKLSPWNQWFALSMVRSLTVLGMLSYILERHNNTPASRHAI